MTVPSVYQLALTQFSTELAGELSIVQYDRGIVDNPGVVFVFQNAKKDNVLPIPVDNFRLHEDDGNLHFSRNGGIWSQVSRGVQLGGSLINIHEASEYDLSAEIWPAQPRVIATEIVNGEVLDLAYLLNGAFTGIPKNEMGVVIAVQDDPNVPKRLSAYLQIYAKLEDKKPFAVLSTDVANHFPVNPMYPTNTDLGPKWFDAYENSDLTPENVQRSIIALQQRRNFKGQYLGYGDDPATLALVHPPELSARAKEVLGELVLIPGTGALNATPRQVPITGGGGLNQVVYGSQTNTVVGKARPVKMNGLRSDLWALIELGGQATKDHALAWGARGGTGSNYQINTTPAAPQNTAVPYIEVLQHDPTPNSPVFMGTVKGTKVGDFGFSVRVNKGMYLNSPHRIMLNYTGAAS